MSVAPTQPDLAALEAVLTRAVRAALATKLSLTERRNVIARCILAHDSDDAAVLRGGSETRYRPTPAEVSALQALLNTARGKPSWPLHAR